MVIFLNDLYSFLLEILEIVLAGKAVVYNILYTDPGFLIRHSRKEDNVQTRSVSKLQGS